ncbi:MAG: hypothetical protein GY793_03140 [Proteobacteria bacterium]|nr:hypothetical protein [Pseudomonadota bacterium]
MRKMLIIAAVSSLLTINSAFAFGPKVAATVNGKKIFDSEIKRNLQQIPNYESLPLDQQKLIKNKIVSATGKLIAVVQEARKLNIHESKEFKNKLNDFKNQLMYSTLLEEHIKNFITEKKLKEFYNKNKSKYLQTKANASHILVENKKKAEEVIQKLNAGEDFDSLAKEFSTGPSSNDGGNLGWFNKDDMVEAFSKATFALKEKQFTQKPVQTQFGWHVIYLKEKMEGVAILFEKVKNQIEQELAQAETKRYISTILKKSDIIINEE